MQLSNRPPHANHRVCESNRSVPCSSRAGRLAVGVLLVILAVHDAAAATRGDPFERFNRKGFAIQVVINRYLVGPAARVFRILTPGVIGHAVHHILVNLSEPNVIVNDLLQLRPKRAGEASARFVINSTIGVAGAVDVARREGLPHHPSSFGDTLAHYGAQPGAYLFFPFIGPTTVRDLFGNVVDIGIDPLYFVQYPARQVVSLSVAGVGGLDKWERSKGDLHALLVGATDPYATLRSAYLQHRESEISGHEQIPELPSLDSPESPDPSVAPPKDPSASGGRSDAAGQAPALLKLPGGQDRKSDDQITSPLNERQGDGHVGPQTEQGPEHGVADFLDAQTHGRDDESAAGGQHQALQPEDRQWAGGDAAGDERQPDTQRAGEPGQDMDGHGEGYARWSLVDSLDVGVDFGGHVGGGWRETFGETRDDA